MKLDLEAMRKVAFSMAFRAKEALAAACSEKTEADAKLLCAQAADLARKYDEAIRT